MPETKPTVMISSTSLDLPEHRKAAMEACLRQGLFPIAMEHLPARDADAIRVSLEMVNKADVYVGIFAWRYGYVPEGHDISVTEMEFNRAVERGLPILVFTIHKDHPLTIDMVQADTVSQEKLKRLKERACDGRGRLEFKSAEELRGHLIQSLGAWLKEQEAASGEKRVASLHPPNIIPTAPAPYLAHPYSLLQTKDVIGRQPELKLLTDWVTTNQRVPRDVRLFNIVAIGGMGKSALTWKWFNEIAPNELPDLKGRMWWSFYESDAYFENFVIRALAYTSGMTEAEVRTLPSDEREDQLFRLLDERPFLLVLDGLERILLAYARMDAAHLDDLSLGAPASLRAEEKPRSAPYSGLSEEPETREEEGYAASFPARRDAGAPRHRLRQCADPRAGRFLRRLARVSQSRILISTRLFPADLQTNTAQPWPGSYGIELTGLSDDDALALWRAFINSEHSGTSERLLPYFNAFGNYPLLLRALAGEVAEYKPAPGDFDHWLNDHPDFNPAQLDLRNARTHVLEYALANLSDAHARTLHTLAAFRMPATWETLCAVLVGKGKKKPCRNQGALVEVLTELEDRGLVGWDKVANRYDLHPIVRGVVWNGLRNNVQRGVYANLHSYFEGIPKIDDSELNRWEDLTPAIELYNTLIGLKRYEDAFVVFRDRLDDATLYRLGTSRLRIELLEMLISTKSNQLPSSIAPSNQAHLLSALAQGCQYDGQVQRAILLHRRANAIHEATNQTHRLCVGLGCLADALWLSGKVYESEFAARRAILVTRANENRFWEPVNLYWLAWALSVRGVAHESKMTLLRALRIIRTQAENPEAQAANQFECSIILLLGLRGLWFGDLTDAQKYTNRGWEMATGESYITDFIQAAQRQGAVALRLQNFAVADEKLTYALFHAREVNLNEEVTPSLIALAELRVKQGRLDEARDLLSNVWEIVERGPYPPDHAAALNVLAQLERDAGQREAAVKAATEAYRLAWCDGPPYAYHWGLVAAQKHLEELGAPLPDLPPFDPAQHEPMPEVEIDPDDEFHVGESA